MATKKQLEDKITILSDKLDYMEEQRDMYRYKYFEILKKDPCTEKVKAFFSSIRDKFSSIWKNIKESFFIAGGVVLAFYIVPSIMFGFIDGFFATNACNSKTRIVKYNPAFRGACSLGRYLGEEVK